MPSVTKQMARPAQKRVSGDSSVLGRIQPVSQHRVGVKVLVFGQSKTGKTSFAGTLPKPMLLIGTEEGTTSVANVKGLDFVLIRSSEEFGEITQMLADGKYQSVGLDTAGGLQDLIVKEVLGLDEVPVQRSYGMGSGQFKDSRQMWGVVGMQFKERMRRFLDLADTAGLKIVVVAHERNFADENANPDVVFPTIGAALTPSAAGWLHAACDCLTQCFKRPKLRETTTKVGDKQLKQQVRTGEVEFCLRIGPHDVYVTEIRRPNRDKLPDCIVDADWTKLSKFFGREV